MYGAGNMETNWTSDSVVLGGIGGDMILFVSAWQSTGLD